MAAAATTVTVCSKLPWDFKAEFGGVTVTFNGAKALDPFDGKTWNLTQGYGLTPGVDEDWFNKWVQSVGDFAAVTNGSIFAETTNKAADAAKELAQSIKSGFEQKTDAEVGVEISAG